MHIVAKSKAIQKFYQFGNSVFWILPILPILKLIGKCLHLLAVAGVLETPSIQYLTEGEKFGKRSPNKCYNELSIEIFQVLYFTLSPFCIYCVCVGLLLFIFVVVVP